MKNEFTKSEHKLLRQLSGEAWESELSLALSELMKEFSAWQGKRMNAFDLSQKIHEFHDGASRHLYVMYTTLDAPFLVARAVARGILHRDRLGEHLAGKLAPRIEEAPHDTEDHEADDEDSE